MKVSILHLIKGAQKAEGLTVIIDVFRAFSLECYLYANNAELIIPVADLTESFRLGTENPEFILIGERNERKVEGFQYGNSPNQILGIDFTGKTIIHTTSAGTQGIIQASKAEELITGSFVNAGAIIKYIQQKNPKKVSLVCMGYSAKKPTEEDTLCAQYIYNQLKGYDMDFEKIINTIRNTSGSRFFDPKLSEHNPSEDFDLCLDINRFNFIIRAEKQINGLIFNKKIEIDR
jgi:2-phosphosulfolactate phosphatase